MCRILELGGAGFLVHWFKYFNQLGNDCLHPTLVYAGDVRRVEMMHMHGCYVILGVGVTASVIAFVLELLYWKGIRPFLPESFRTSNVSVMDYYNKIFIGYGYSNARVMTPKKSKNTTTTRTTSSLFSFGRHNNNNNNNENKGRTSPRESIGSANSRTGLYDNRQQNNNYTNNAKTSYNTTKNYMNNYSNYAATQKSEFRTKFGL